LPVAERTDRATNRTFFPRCFSRLWLQSELIIQTSHDGWGSVLGRWIRNQTQIAGRKMLLRY
jgi:hypothetical protein